MSGSVIQIRNLSKSYQINHKVPERNKTLRDLLVSNFEFLMQTLNPLAKPRTPSSLVVSQETFWALKDISLDIKKGDRVGIIGHNGAGKSTLLKILSRITEPSSGTIHIRGRVASLLEVGTGFHPELTGRENIYLNGAILGMSKEEIHKKFDAIVAFAGVEKFLDTPVKRYSSGMYVRLAFAIAAHLEPDVLIVDEVLAVGDADFQRKCLGKMGEIATEEGRTILFVSHNMQAIRALCNKAYQLHKGELIQTGSPENVIANYFSSISQVNSGISWEESQAPGNDELRLVAVRVYSENEAVGNGVFSSQKDLFVEISFVINKAPKALCIGFDLMTLDGITIFRSYQTDLPTDQIPDIHEGCNHFRCCISAGLLNTGTYYVCPRIGVHNLYWIVHIDAVVKFEVILNHGVSPFWNSLSEKKHRPGIISPILNWKSLN